jgi:hypothetical protein
MGVASVMCAELNCTGRKKAILMRCAILSPSAHVDIPQPAIFYDCMVLQRGIPQHPF